MSVYTVARFTATLPNGITFRTNSLYHLNETMRALPSALRIGTYFRVERSIKVSQ